MSAPSAQGLKTQIQKEQPVNSKTRSVLSAFSCFLMLTALLITLQKAYAAPQEPPSAEIALVSHTITTCGTVITSPGTYTVANNLTCAGDGVDIQSNSVTLKLNGFIIAGRSPGAGGVVVVSSTGAGLKSVTILGPGVIRNFGTGISFQGTNGGGAVDVTVTANGFGIGPTSDNANVASKGLLISQNDIEQNVNHGITTNALNTGTIVGNKVSNNGVHGIYLFAGTGNMVLGNTCDGNGTDGIHLGDGVSTGNTVKGNQANSNSNAGINIGSGGSMEHFSGNLALGNRVLDISDSNSNCATDTYSSDVFRTSNQPCVK
jgi:parallel beta-helix repeat protein